MQRSLKAYHLFWTRKIDRSPFRIHAKISEHENDQFNVCPAGLFVCLYYVCSSQSPRKFVRNGRSEWVVSGYCICVHCTVTKLTFVYLHQFSSLVLLFGMIRRLLKNRDLFRFFFSFCSSNFLCISTDFLFIWSSHWLLRLVKYTSVSSFVDKFLRFLKSSGNILPKNGFVIARTRLNFKKNFLKFRSDSKATNITTWP